jgi:hypothetical protein
MKSHQTNEYRQYTALKYQSDPNKQKWRSGNAYLQPDCLPVFSPANNFTMLMSKSSQKPGPRGISLPVKFGLN